MENFCVNFQVQLVPWTDAAQPELAALRMQVFVHEQGVPPELELDEIDSRAVHAVARDASGKLAGTGRLFAEALSAEDDPTAITTPGPTKNKSKRAHIGRMAVLPEYRGCGCGAAILNALIRRAREDGYKDIILSAQTHAAPFYAKAGFLPVGDVYLDCDIPHQDMLLNLNEVSNGD